MEEVRVQLGYTNMFCVDAVGHSGGLAMLWSSIVQLQIITYSSNHIDTTISLDVDTPTLRFTGYYGYPEGHRQREAWRMLRQLAGESLLPWVIMGDYNDLMYQADKRGHAPHPPWQINSFRETIADCGLREMPFDGAQLTWTRSRGRPNMVQEKLDRIFVSHELFSDLREDRCREIVVRSWDDAAGRDVLTKLQWCGRDIWRWGRNYNKDFMRRIESCKATMDALRDRVDAEGLMRYARADNELLRLLEQQHLFWKQRAKEHWYKGGDLNSKFFHNSVKTRRHKNKVKRLKDGSGNWVQGEETVGQVMLSYFENLFKPDNGDMQEVIEIITSQVSALDNAKLLRPVSEEEVRRAVFQIHPDKSPGPDGLGPGFFQHYWDIVGKDVTMFCHGFIEMAKLPEKASDTFIVLVPKKPSPESMADLRPIALCNVVYTIVAKVCANRMKSLLDYLISGSQGAFVPGRLITDNVMLAYEVHHYLKRKTQGREGVDALKVDMSKAYDRVQWDFLEAVLVRMGFARRWVDVLLESVSAVRYHILHEQRELGLIIPGRGLRQGDPLSPSQPVRDDVVRILGVAEGNKAGKYLGLPSLVGKRKKEILGYLKEQILTRVRIWNSKFLSRAGREVLLKNVIQAMPSYAMMVFLLPTGLCKDIETLMTEYWWTGSVGSGKVCINHVILGIGIGTKKGPIQLRGDLLAKYVMACCGIWTSRNDNVWSGIAFDINLILRRTMSFWENWRQAQVATHQHTNGDIATNITRWTPPPVGKLKLNSDATINQVANAMGFGWVLRDEDGAFLAAKNMQAPRSYTVEEAEAMSLREALSWLKDTGMGDVVVEIDSQLVFHAILTSPFSSAYGFLVDDIRELASMIGDVQFGCVRRSANCAAHIVAREAFSVAGCGEWFDVPPDFLISCLANDLMQ
ncbi:PREDICTED: uncharacterized protein LOC109163513 [Ipomoea nil]|uniref:uncharacterized protein LOC109163513 n=1 Tax=Ipomoea nil TaxID=35883 RepID=UPI0009015B93|nr:PREDICTED: uncharacterized protein LOC109163513 [Ipomoea nil]